MIWMTESGVADGLVAARTSAGSSASVDCFFRGGGLAVGGCSAPPSASYLLRRSDSAICP